MRKLLFIILFAAAVATVLSFVALPASAGGFSFGIQLRDGTTIVFGGVTNRDRGYQSHRYYEPRPYDGRYHPQYELPRKKRLWGHGERVGAGEYCPHSLVYDEHTRGFYCERR